MRYFRFIALLTCIFTANNFFAKAQNPGTGLYQFSTQDNRGFDSINVGNLNVHFSIPIVSKQGRGTAFQYALTYDSSIWSVLFPGTGSTWSPDPSFGLKGTLNNNGFVGALYYTQMVAECDSNGDNSYVDNFIFSDKFGINHSFNYSENLCLNPSSGVFIGDGLATDGSGYSIALAPYMGGNHWTIYAPDGSALIVPTYPNGTPDDTTQVSIDPNGNQITLGSNGAYVDTTGSTALTVSGGSTANSPTQFTYATPTGTATATLYYETATVQTAFNCANIAEYGPQPIDLPSSIVLGDGVTTYAFSYEPTPGNPNAVTGRIQTITLPGGGTINYRYTGSCSGGINTNGTLASLQRITSDGTVTYQSTSSSEVASKTIVTDNTNDQSVYLFSIAGGAAGLPAGHNYEIPYVAGTPFETHRQIWQGPAGSTPNANTLLEQFTCYSGHAFPCDGDAVSAFFSGESVRLSQNSGQYFTTTTTYNSTELPTSIATVDYGGSTFTPLSTTTEQYGSPATAITAVTQKDSAGTLYASTTYGYDETSLTPSNAPQLATVTGARGNQTSSHQQIDAAGDMLSTTASYYDTGLPITSTGPAGPTNNTTQYSYDSTSQTFLTGVTLPTPTSGVSLATGASYNVGAGVPSVTTDYNSNQTQYKTYDNLLRPTEIDYPDTGKTTITYAPNQIGVHTYTDSTNYQDQETYYDGYGRPIHVGVLSQNGTQNQSAVWYWTDYCYDSNGFLHNKTYSHAGTATPPTDCSSNGDIYSVDALGRLTLTTHFDGTTASTYYYQQAVETTSETGRQIITQYDALGRPTFVCEVTSTALPNSGTPSSCGLDIPGTGYRTSYTYSLANHQTTIAQGTQTRIIKTDWLGRTTSVQEPEMIAEGQPGGSQGVTTYGYSYNATGQVVTRTKPTANQASATVLTNTTTQYDTLGRILSVSYTDGTPTKTFTYDAVPSGWNPVTNVKGQLAGTTRTSSTNYTANAFSYDPMGRVNLLQECLPSGCGTSTYIQSIPYSYYLSGNLETAGDGQGGTITYGLTQAGEITSITNPNGTLPSNLLSNVVNGPNGPISFSYGNGLTGAVGYDSLGRQNASSVCNNNSLITGCGGSANQMYGYTVSWNGSRAASSSDTVMGVSNTYGYGNMDQLTSTTNAAQTLNMTYDRWGNRISQSCTGTGTCPSPTYSLNTATNHITSTSVYDAAGNLTSDGLNAYTYDADGNVIAVNAGTTASYSYDALNERVRVDLPTPSASQEYVFDQNGKRLAVWDTLHNLLTTVTYWGSTPLAFTQNGSLHFEHQDWIGTERLRTTQAGGVEGIYTSLPYGDSYNASGADNDAYHFAQLDQDTDLTSHAPFRQYSSIQGRWMSMDPYSGSYTPGDPQSFNRYAYVQGQAVSAVDSKGLGLELVGYAPFYGMDGASYNPIYYGILDYGIGGAYIQAGAPVGSRGGGAGVAPSNQSMLPRGTLQATTSTCNALATATGTSLNWAKSDGKAAATLLTGAGLTPASAILGKVFSETAIIFGTAAGVEGIFSEATGALYKANSCPTAPTIP